MPNQLELLRRAAGLLILRGKPFLEVGQQVIFPAVSVGSTNVELVGPYNVMDNTLDITYRGGRLYRYSDIPLEEYYNILKAPSKGQFINIYIAYNYPYERLS